MTHSTKLPPPLPPSGISIKPGRLRWSIDDLLTKDGHRMSVAFMCTARAIDEPAERQLFTEAFSASPKSGSDSAIAHFRPGLRSAGAELARQETSEELLGIPARARWISVLKSAANEIGFGCGIEVLAPFEVEVTSPTLQKERLEQMQRIAAERRSADRVGHFARAAELLKQWESLKADIPAITPGKLLEQINPADRGLMLDTLLMAGSGGKGSQSSSELWAVSGSYLVRIDVRAESPQSQLITLPTTLGPLRSIRSQSGKLLIGARSGAFVVDPMNPESAVAYRHSKLNSEYGFTSVTQISNQLWACHRDGGLIGWDVAGDGEPSKIFAPAGLGAEPRLLTEQGHFAAGSRLFTIASTGPVVCDFRPTAAIAALLLVDHQLLVVDEAGTITTLDNQTLEKIAESNTNGKITSASLLPWLSGSRLLLNRADGPIECIGLEDQLVTRFGSNHTGMRAVTANPGKVAAMSNDRQRILIWNSWEGRTPAVEIHVTGQTHHRIGGLTFI